MGSRRARSQHGSGPGGAPRLWPAVGRDRSFINPMSRRTNVQTPQETKPALAVQNLHTKVSTQAKPHSCQALSTLHAGNQAFRGVGREDHEGEARILRFHQDRSLHPLFARASPRLRSRRRPHREPRPQRTGTRRVRKQATPCWLPLRQSTARRGRSSASVERDPGQIPGLPEREVLKVRDRHLPRLNKRAAASTSRRTWRG